MKFAVLALALIVALAAAVPAKATVCTTTCNGSGNYRTCTTFCY